MTHDELIKKLRTLAIKTDVWMAKLDEATSGAMLFDASRVIASDEVLDEKAITQRLFAWLENAGSPLRIDAIELRRTLVDFQFITRDGYGREYRRAANPPERFREVCGLLEHTDVALLSAQARSAHETERAARKAAHLARSN